MIELVPFPPRRALDGRPLPVLAVLDGVALIGWLCEVEPLRFWWRRPGNPHFAPAATGPSPRDCVDVLLRLKDAPLPPRRGIPDRVRIVPPTEEGPDAD